MKIELKELYRIAGEAKLGICEVDGKIRSSMFLVDAPIRDFEKLLVGRNPFFAIEAVMRICGICCASHANAAAMAVENALGILPPRNALLMREVIGLMNRIQSHTIQLIMVVPDLIKEETASIILKLIEVYNEISDCLLKVGGSATHPPFLTVGGILEKPSEKNIHYLRDKLPKLREKWRDLEKALLNESAYTDIAFELKERKRPIHFLASHFFYGDPYNFAPEKVETMPYWKYREEPEEITKEVEFSVAFYGGEAVEVGPRARFVLYGNFEDTSLLGIHVARVKEVGLSLDRIMVILDSLSFDEPFRNKNIVLGPGEGIGVHEAPRGTLIHRIKLGEEGRVLSMDIIVPTMFNIPVMEKATEKTSLEVAKAVIRLYDPCVPCTTIHAFKYEVL